MTRKKPRKPYQGLRTKREDAEAWFSSLVPQTVVRITIEDTDYSTRPHRVIFWAEFKGEMKPLYKVLANDKDIKLIYQTFKNRLGEIE